MKKPGLALITCTGDMRGGGSGKNAKSLGIQATTTGTTTTTTTNTAGTSSTTTTGTTTTTG